MKKLIIFLTSIALSGGLAMAQDDPSSAETSSSAETRDAKTSPGARIAAYGKVGRVIIDGQSVYISKGLTDIVMEEGSADLEDDTRIKCQQIRRTGSHISMRICRTVAEIEEQSEFNKEYFERWYLRQRNSVCSIGGGRAIQRIGEATQC